MTSYENFYPGTLGTFDYQPIPSADYGDLFTGYRVPFSQLGAPTSIQTANQLQEVSNLLSQGIKTIETQPLSPEVFESIPKQHFKEIERLSKLTGADVTMHAPLVEPSGLTREGWNDWSRQEAERQLKMSVERAHEMSPKGNVPVTIHASQIPAYEWGKGLPQDKAMMVAYDQKSQQLLPLKHEMKYFPGKEEMEEYTPKRAIKIINDTHWGNNVTQLLYYKQRADEMMRKAWSGGGKSWQDRNRGKIMEKHLTPEVMQDVTDIDNAMLFYHQQIGPQFTEMYDEACRYAPKEHQKEIRKYLKEVGKAWEKVSRDYREGEATPMDVAHAYDKIIGALNDPRITPQHYVPVEDFAREKSAQTLANTALHGFIKYGNNAPIVSVENFFPNTAFGRSESLKGLIKEARKKFVEEASEKGISESSAANAAEKLIGATWDVGHINMMRKYGYDKSDVAKETKAIAPFVKHVHITDNFGYNDTHLPPGMGEVPIKEILKELEKQGYSGKQIIEAGGFVQHFKTSPTPYVLEAFGSPLYGMRAAPYWNQMQGTQAAYMGGPLAYLPEQHFSIYGGGFSSLPTELGGQMPGKKSRLSGTPTD